MPVASEDLPWICAECKERYVVRVLARDCENEHARLRGEPLPNPDVGFGHAASQTPSSQPDARSGPDGGSGGQVQQA